MNIAHILSPNFRNRHRSRFYSILVLQSSCKHEATLMYHRLGTFYMYIKAQMYTFGSLLKCIPDTMTILYFFRVSVPHLSQKNPNQEVLSAEIITQSKIHVFSYNQLIMMIAQSSYYEHYRNHKNSLETGNGRLSGMKCSWSQIIFKNSSFTCESCCIGKKSTVIATSDYIDS